MKRSNRPAKGCNVWILWVRAGLLTADIMMSLRILDGNILWASAHAHVQADVLRWRMNPSAATPLQRQICDELELNDDLTVILAGSCGAPLQNVTWKAGSPVWCQHQRAGGRTTLSFSSDLRGAKNKKERFRIFLNRSGFLPGCIPHLLCLTPLLLWRFNHWCDCPPPPFLLHDAAGWDVGAVKGLHQFDEHKSRRPWKLARPSHRCLRAANGSFSKNPTPRWWECLKATVRGCDCVAYTVCCALIVINWMMGGVRWQAADSD